MATDQPDDGLLDQSPSQSQAADVQLPLLEGAEDELDEMALFGAPSDQEEEEDPAPTSVVASVSAPASAPGTLNGADEARSPLPKLSAPSPAPSPAPTDADAFDERDLFGSDVDEPFGEDIDEKDLFGSENENDMASSAPMTKHKTATDDRDESRSVMSSEVMSSMDERDIFGDVSDEEDEKVEDVVLRRRPAPTEDRNFVTMRLPNVLSVEKTPFDPKHLASAVKSGYKVFKDTQGKDVIRLLNPANCVRWRFKKGADGQILTDEDGCPQYESNSRLVEWEDGSRTLHVGSEAFNIHSIPDEVLLFEENSQDIHVCHGFVRSRFIPTPTSVKSSTHDVLKSAQYNKFEPILRSLLISPQEMEESKQVYELEMEQRKRQHAKRMRAAESMADGAEITAAFLEDDQPLAGGGVGPSVAAIKQAYKKPKV
uniref:RNA polymerase-associated protein LEO1 n=1 Tax=Noctiluca scintillans TaxID=2966 RepID=A0A7S1EZN1_NOCSC|eukprot:CAMPEP_0194511268 /NCGR_PEP_ID=MMETSP0253-20130528/42881_1 /TAXON_ID=2966 /ORGANISM="Noctiluca scintillans" /LENGTH=427 /DNA_ID=CAMNT_0039354589 /DNA_START=34 /DNA_END=1317 /DNA_ORIENTATION=-